MFLQIKGRFIASISSWAYLFTIVSLYFSTEFTVSHKTNYMIILSVVSLVSALLLYQRIRLIEDTSKAVLNSAAQGYVEVKGKVSLYNGEIIRGSAMDLPPMVWYSTLSSTSSAGFILEDEKGRCTIDPRDAEVITPQYTYNDQAYQGIYPGESIYVLGQLETLKKHKTEYERNGLVSSKVIEWKRNQLQFLDYFDTNNDGKIDEAEMAFAKNAATREVDEDIEIIYQEPATHIISSPADRRPFLISSIHPEKLLIRYKKAMLGHLFIWGYLSLLVLLR